MEIIRLNPSYIDDLIELWSQSFAFPYEQVSTWVNEKSIRNCIGAIENNKLVSALSIIPMEGYVRGELFSFSGIGGVATLPEKRGKNYVHYLLREAIRISKENGSTFSSLYPFSFEFYRTFGWELGGFQKRYRRKTYSIPKFPEMEKVKRIPLEDWKLIKPVYDKFSKNFSGSIKRTDERWENLIFRTRTLTYLYIYEDKEIEGYLLYSVEKTNINRIVVREMMTLNTSAYKGFLSLFSRQAMTIEEVEWTAPLDDPLPFILTNPRGECSIEPTFMIRVIDVERALSSLKYDENINIKITLKIKDEHGEWNDGIWNLEIENGKGNLEKKDGLEYDIAININTLSQIIIGTISPKTAYNLGYIEVNNFNALNDFNKLFSEYPTFCWDYF